MSAKDEAYQILKDDIMSLRLKPGEILSELELSDRLKLSRTPVREILMRLKNEYLIEVKPQSGTLVSLIDRNLIDEAMFARVTLEKALAKEVVKNRNPEFITYLKENLDAQKRIVTKSDHENEFHQLDLQFHRSFFAEANKLYVWQGLLSISTHYNRMRQLVEGASNIDKIILQHEALIKLIESRKSHHIDDFYDEHVIAPSLEWDAALEANPELKRYLK